MTEEERLAQKQLHKRIRDDAKLARDGKLKLVLAPFRWHRYISHREMLLLWGYARGFKFRRLERSHHTQVREDGSVYEHNMPSAGALAQLCTEYLGGDHTAAIAAWLADPTGAIPAPPPRPKKPYVPPALQPNVAAE